MLCNIFDGSAYNKYRRKYYKAPHMNNLFLIYLVGFCASLIYGTLVCREDDGTIEWQMFGFVIFMSLLSWIMFLAFFVGSNLKGHDNPNNNSVQ